MDNNSDLLQKRKEKIDELKKEIDLLQQEYESRLKPIALEIAFNIEAQMGKMSEDEIFDKFQVRNAEPSMIGDCVYKICQQLERQPSRKSILEMMFLTKYFRGKEETAMGLAGVGDLYVSAAGGRNSKMGSYLGKGYTFKIAKKRFMPNDTVEGEQLVREIAPYILKKINKKEIPLMINLFRAILNNKKLKIS